MRMRFGTKAVALAVAAMALSAAAARADQWTKPTPEELAMTSVPGYPGAPAIYLNREKITRDDLHVVQYYERLKVLTEKGKSYANVEINFASRSGEDKIVDTVSGRTIHPDGTIVPFTGKPFLKTIVKSQDYSYQARVFTMPDVEVGSIIEYRYAERISDNLFEAPNWYVQSDLFTRTAHYLWYPTTQELSSSDGDVNSITVFPILPAGVKVDHKDAAIQQYELTVHDVPPAPEEDFMPPIKSLSYRVLFSYSPYHTAGDFWKSRGKDAFKEGNAFAGPNAKLREATRNVIAAGDSDDQKLRKIYALVETLENSDYTRTHESAEDKAAGLHKLSSAMDVLTRKRGDSVEIAELFAGMARAAGLDASLMLVPDGSDHLFVAGDLSLNQFDHMIVIVKVGGTEQFFDPGSRYAPYGQLAWQYAFMHGLRQAEGGAVFAETPGGNYLTNKTQRISDLTIDDHGQIHGKLTLTYTGAPALVWRHRALRGDDESLKRRLLDTMEKTLPRTLQLKIDSVSDIADYEKPMKVVFDVTGTMGAATGKRMILPADPFLANEKTAFPEPTRDIAIDFEYPNQISDAARVIFPATMSVEAVPAADKKLYKQSAEYIASVAQTAHSVTFQRTMVTASILIPAAEYADLQKFFNAFEAEDKGSVVLKTVASTPPVEQQPTH